MFYKIVLLGDCGIGSKTSLIKALTCDKFDPNEDPTIYPKYVNKEIALKNGYKINFEIWDTPGQEKYRSINKLFIKNSDCVVLGYDITRIETFENICNFWYPTAKEIISTNLFYLIADKIDLYENETVKEEKVMEYAKNKNMRYFMYFL